MLKPLPHQIEKSEDLYRVLTHKGVAYLAGEVRSGKTLTAILTANKMNINRVLVLTRKSAIEGWKKFQSNMKHEFVITNYEQVTKISFDFDLIIVDEAHNLGKTGKATKRVTDIRKVAYQLPALLLSGTPFAETRASLFHQFCITKYSPFNEYKNFYKWFKDHGIVEYQNIVGRQIAVYKRCHDTVEAKTAPYFVTMTQKEAGIETSTQDKVHYVELSPETKKLYNTFLKHSVAVVDGEKIICKSKSALCMKLHQLETGDEKFRFIKDNFTGKIAVMSHFIDERARLAEALPNIDIFSSNRHAEGVDLSQYDHFIILSSDYSGAKFIQRRERNVNINNKTPTEVHHLLVKGAMSEQIYNSVSKKRDFNSQLFNKEDLC